MKRRNAGFTLVEMLVVIAIFGLVLAGISDMFISMLRTHRQQSRIAETNIEGIIGLELLRQDLEKAGYGLPWHGTFNYAEKDPNTYFLNDGPASAPGAANAPRGIVSANNVTQGPALLGTDYLVIKAANVATNKACSRWTFLLDSATTTTWLGQPSDNFDTTDRVIVISPGAALASARTLISASTPFGSVTGFAASVSGPETRVVYGIDAADTLNPTNPLRMPFNRADYFVMQPSSSEMPKRCALRTGILYKGIVNQSNGNLTYMPLLDCVADMQVIFRWTNPADAGNLTTIHTYDDISVLPDAEAIRNQVKEVRVFILAHEGQKDTGYRHPFSSIYVGESPLGRPFDLTTIPDWQNYRWKVYTLVVRLDNLN